MDSVPKYTGIHRATSPSPADDIDNHTHSPFSPLPSETEELSMNMGRTRLSLSSERDDGTEEPLLESERGRRSLQENYNTEEGIKRRQQLRSVSPSTASAHRNNKQRYFLVSICLALALITFVVQTETAFYIQHELKWKKSYCMLYLTHSSWSLLWPAQLLMLKLRKRSVPWKTFLRSHLSLIKTTAQMVKHESTTIHATESNAEIMRFGLITVTKITLALTVAASSWYVAVNLTTPGDLTAIYNCNAFFAYAFSIPLLKEKLRLDKITSVIMAIIGVFIVAYGDGSAAKKQPNGEISTRLWGNLFIGAGSVVYGLYEVMYKKMACPPIGTSSGRSLTFSVVSTSMIGIFTFFVLWIPLPILHVLNIETFELPQGKAAWLLLVSVLANAIFSGSFLGMISLTNPVLGAVAALLTIFLVTFVDWVLWNERVAPAAIFGGLIIVAAFLLLSWATLKELNELEEEKDLEVESSDDNDESQDPQRV